MKLRPTDPVNLEPNTLGPNGRIYVRGKPGIPIVLEIAARILPQLDFEDLEVSISSQDESFKERTLLAKISFDMAEALIAEYNARYVSKD